MCCKVFTVKWHPKQWGAEFVLPWKRGMNFKHHTSLLPSVQRQWHCVKIWERKSFLFLLVLEVWWNHYLVCSGCQVTNSQVDRSISVLYVGRMLTADCILHSQSFSRGSVKSSPHLTVTLFADPGDCWHSKYRLTPAVFRTLDGKNWWKVVLGRSDLLFAIWSWAASSDCHYRIVPSLPLSY